MKRKIFISLAALVISVSAAVSASAAEVPGYGCAADLRFWYWPSICTQLPCVPSEPQLPAQPSEPEQPDTPTQPVEPEQPSTPDTVDSVSAYEQEVVRLVNVERARYGLSALCIRADLCGYARVKSQDMHDSGYFSHTSPNYGSPFDMMKSFGVTYSHAGENIAMGYSTPAAVVEAWMNSEGHRANILSASYTELGVGYVADGGYWTQWFVG